MSCCHWNIPSYIKRFGDQIASWFTSKDIQSVSVVTNPMLALNTKQYPPIITMQKLSKIHKSSISREIIDDLVKGKTSRYRLATYYMSNHFDIGLPIFYCRGVTSTFNQKLKEELLTNSGTGETDTSLIQFLVYNDENVPTDEAMAYHYMEHNGYNRTTENRVVLRYVIDPNAIDINNNEYIISTANLTDDGNEYDLGVDTTLLITDIHAFTKQTTPIGADDVYITIQLLDESNNNVYYHELCRCVLCSSTVLNKIIVVYGIIGYDCCYYYEYLYGSNLVPELENKDSEESDSSYGIFTMLPVVPLKYNGEYVYDMKDTNYTKYIQTKRVCSKLGLTLKSLHNIITDTGTTPSDELEATTSQNNTKDVFLEFGLNVDRDTIETMKALYLTFNDYYTYTTSWIDVLGNNQYIYNIKHDDSTDSRYNKSIESINIHKEEIVGRYRVYTSNTEYTDMRDNSYMVEKYVLYPYTAPLLEDSSNGYKQYQIDDNNILYTDIYNEYTTHNTVLRCIYQGKDSYTIIDVYDLTVSSTIEDSGNKKGISITLLDTFYFSDTTGNQNLIIPLTREVLIQLSFVQQYNIYDQAIHITYFASTITTLSWYQKDGWIKFFQIVLYVVSAVVLYYSAGSASSISEWLISVALAIGAGYALKKALESTNNKFLKAIIVIVYIAVMTVSSTDTSTTTDQFMMLLASNALQVSNTFLHTESEEIRKEMMSVLDDLNESQRELDKRVRNYDKDELDFNLELFRTETFKEFYDRIISIDLVEQADLMVEAILSTEYKDFDIHLLPV